MFTPVFIAMIILLEEILEKEDFQYGKHNKKFDQNNDPNPSSPTRHAPESIVIKMEYPV